jgi:hypothetical protein
MSLKDRGRSPPFKARAQAGKIEGDKLAQAQKPPPDRVNREGKRASKDGERKLLCRIEQRERRQRRLARQAAGDVQFHRR